MFGRSGIVTGNCSVWERRKRWQGSEVEGKDGGVSGQMKCIEVEKWQGSEVRRKRFKE